MLIFINEHLFGDVGLSDGISIIFNKYDDQDRDKETIICLTLNIGCLSGKNISKHIVLRFKFPLIDSCSDSKKEKLQKDIDLIESIIKFMAVEIEKSLYLSIINNKNNISIPDLIDDFIQSKINKDDIPILKKYSTPLMK